MFSISRVKTDPPAAAAPKPAESAVAASASFLYLVKLFIAVMVALQPLFLLP